jgi:chemotaxis protein methyltransferase CheR
MGSAVSRKGGAMTQIEHPELARFRSFISERTGLYFDDRKSEFLEHVLIQSVGLSDVRSVEAYLRHVSPLSIQEPEFQALVERLTVNETYFFRNSDQFQALKADVLPQCARAERPIRIVSAGCSSGEEAYSLAIAASEHFGAVSPLHFRVHAIDINTSVLAKAQKAHYTPWSLRATPDDIKQRWFKLAGKNFILDEAIRGAVSFETRSITDDSCQFWRAQSIDILFCCNVIMYFSAETIQSMIGRFAQAIRPGGYLFLGHAESLRGLTQNFQLCQTHGTFYYQRRPTSNSRFSTNSGSSSHWTRVDQKGGAAQDDTWMEGIRRSSDRIEQLAQQRSGKMQSIGAQPGKTAEPALGLDSILQLLSHERFAEALQAWNSLTESRRFESDAKLLQAVLLTNMGQLAEARQVCIDMLSLDPRQAGIRYVLGVCHEHAGDNVAAGEHHRAAIETDPYFAMPHMRLGVLARRSREWAEARCELARAQQLLGAEDPSRIVLFGGGFGRDALVSLCRAELRALGGKA